MTRAESEHKSERTRRAQLQAAQAGKWLGGRQPFGWTLRDNGNAVLDRGEAREVRNACTSLLAGASLGSIVADLNNRGVTTSTGRPWNYTSLRQVLTRPRNAGLSVLNGETVGTSTWPSMVTEETWRAVCGLLTDPTRRRSTSNRARWLLAGIATCGTCGTPLKSATVAQTRSRGTTRTIYRCPAPGTGHVARASGSVDEHVSRYILALLARPKFIIAMARPSGPDGESLRVEAISIRSGMGEAADLFAEGKITGAQLVKITARLQERLDDVEARMARAARGTALAPFLGRDDPVEVWGRLPIDRQRALVRELMTVRILRSGRRGTAYDPDLTLMEPRTL